MTRDEWAVLGGYLDCWWPYRFTSRDEEAWWPLFADFDRAAVANALQLAVIRDPDERPKAGRLLEAVRGDGAASVPTFAEVAAAVDGGMRRAARANAVESQVTGQITPQAEQALYDYVADLAGPIASSFAQTEGYHQVQRWGLHDPDHGPARYRMIQDRWREYADRILDRLAAGVPIQQATARRLARGGLRPLDALAALGRDENQLELPQEATP
jgi:hypothetical protein